LAQTGEDEDHSSEYFTADYDGVTPIGGPMNGQTYNRVVPDQFGEDT